MSHVFLGKALGVQGACSPLFQLCSTNCKLTHKLTLHVCVSACVSVCVCVCQYVCLCLCACTFISVYVWCVFIFFQVQNSRLAVIGQTVGCRNSLESFQSILMTLPFTCYGPLTLYDMGGGVSKCPD